jgi:hypothetical protein
MTAYRQRLIAFEEQKQREAAAQAKASKPKPARKATTKPTSSSKTK